MEPERSIVVDDEGYETASTSTSYVSSIASEIRNGIEEYGRRWAAYGKHFYGLPIDDEEQDRNDLQHCKFFLMYEERLHLAPMIPDPQRILDLGTGSGIWAIAMADQYRSAQVLGVDIAVVQPSWVPTNCDFEILDVETDWELRKNSFDFIHGREFLFAIRDWPALISQAYEHLRPGGYLELAMTLPDVSCDDGSCPPDAAYAQMSKVYHQIAGAMGMDGYACTLWSQQLIDRGFEDVHERVFKIPMNQWPKDKRLKLIGMLELQNFLTYTHAGFERGAVGLLGMDRTELEIRLALTRQDVLNRDFHTYVKFYNVYGRKPGAPAAAEPPFDANPP